MIKKAIYLVIIGIFMIPCVSFSQTEPQDIAVVSNEFEDLYFESLKQKGIENYDKAIIALEKCLQLQPNEAVVYFELGKNYFFQKNYRKAYEYFENATKLDPKNRWYWAGMYDVSYETKNYNQAITIVQKLIEFKSDYKEDLVSLYMNTSQFDKALDLINELNENVGKSEKRELYKSQILKDRKYQGSEKNNLLEQIKKFPKEESNYIALIYLYSQSNQEEKALEIAKKLEKEIPNSEWAQVSLFKFHLNNNDGKSAVKSMNMVLPSSKIDSKIKHRVFNEFLIFTQSNPQFEPELDKAIGYFENDKEIKVSKEVGKYYYSKKDFDKAIKYFERHLSSNEDDIEIQIFLLQTYTEQLKFEKIVEKTESLMQLFPTQPHFYYYSGLAYNQINNYKKAKESLETGLDFVIDDLALEINFNIQLGEAYNGLGDMKKKEKYFTKANELLKSKK